MLLLIQLLLCLSQGIHYVRGDDLFYDLNTDPNEADTTQSLNVNNSDVFRNLLERSKYWSEHVVVNEDIDITYKKHMWKKNGGISSWLVDNSSTSTVVPDKYNFSGAPNIVFVLVDDWGWNDVGYRSTYLNWTTPTIDRLASEGVKLENYFSSYLCVPARGALLTGRYPIRLGLWKSSDGAELPLSEVTLGQEMQSAGYRTYMVGKWHLGFSTAKHTPTHRGFDSSYSYWNGFVDYWTKSYASYTDLHNGVDLVTDPEELSSDLHNGILMQTKAEAAIADHAANYNDQPMFLYYAMQLIHGEWSAPESYLQRCSIPTTITDDYVRNVTHNYCALNVMLDEAVANLTCALETYGMADNTVLVLVSDNGGEQTVEGNSYPFVGNKGSYFRGGLSATGLVHSKKIPVAARGSPYYGQMHVTDWLPTLMGLATNNEWTGSMVGAELDGVDQWAAITTPGTASPRSEILHYHDGESVSSIQIDMMKLNLGDDGKEASSPEFVFEKDMAPENAAQTCTSPSLMSESSLGGGSDEGSSVMMGDTVVHGSSNSSFFGRKMSILMILLLITLIMVMSVRLASMLGKQDEDIGSQFDIKADYESSPSFSESSRLLI